MNIEYPQTVEEAAAIFQQAVSQGRPVIPAGRLTSLKIGAELEQTGGVVISARDLTGFAAEPENLLALAGAGLTPDQVNAALQPTGLYWPVTGHGQRSLGGLLAEGVAGAETMARGSMIDWILGQTLITPAGRAVKSGGRTLKNVSGYDYTRLGWRARGRLGFSAGFILKLLPRPAASPVFDITTAGAAEAAALAEKIIIARLWPEALRLVFDGRTTRLLVWLTGFSEMVEHKRRALSILAGDRRPVQREDGFAHWREHDRQWPADAPDLRRFLGSRRNILALAAALDAGRPALSRADLDIGGGRAALGSALSLEQLAAVFPGLVPDRFASSGPVYERLKKGLDPQGLVFPEVHNNTG